MDLLYILDNNNKPVPVKDVLEWAAWYEESKNRIVKQDWIGDTKVSTIFLGTDYSYSDEGPPVLWETMIFSPEKVEEYQNRYSSHEEAMKGHEAAVDMVKNWDVAQLVEPLAVN